MAMSSVKSNSGFVDNWQSGKSLAECNLHMMISEASCDVSFRVGKDKKPVRAHRYVLISRSCVFHAMLCGPLSEKDEISISDVEADNFSQFLRYLYTNESAPTHQNVTALLYLAKKYAVGGLEHLCLTYLESSLSAENACVILEQAHVFDEKQLYDRAMQVILDSGEKCFGSEGFKNLSRECFDKVICVDAEPQLVFNAAILWSEEECRRQGREITPANLRLVLGETLYNIPFPSMDPKTFVDEVIQRQILTSDETVIIMSHHVRPERDPSPFRKKIGVPNTKPSVEKMKSVDVVFYNRHKKKHTLENTTGIIIFTCNQNVVLLGIYVYGPAAVTRNKYHLKVGRMTGKMSVLYVFDWLIDDEYNSSPSSKFYRHHINRIDFAEPLHIKTGNEYFLRASVIGGEMSEYEGDSLLPNIDVNQCAFTNIRNQSHWYKSPCNLIYGFILKD